MTQPTTIAAVGAGMYEPQHFPYPMARFGQTPAGKNLWRIVFADSVRRLVWGTMVVNGAPVTGHHYVKAYQGPAARGRWVLESWIPPGEFAGGLSREEYALRFDGVEGSEPWPAEGVYVERYVFDSAPGTDVSVEWLIAKWNHDQGIGFSERRRLRQEQIDHEQKKTSERNVDRLVDLQPNPNGSMMIRKRRQINLKPAKAFKGLPKAGFAQVSER